MPVVFDASRYSTVPTRTPGATLGLARGLSSAAASEPDATIQIQGIHAPHVLGLERLDLAERDELRVVQRHDSTTQGLHVGQDVRRERAPSLLAHATVPAGARAARVAQGIQPRRGLVEERDAGIVDQRLRQAHLLGHAGREPAQLAVCCVLEAELGEPPSSTLLAGPRRQAEHGAHIVEELDGRHLGRQRVGTRSRVSPRAARSRRRGRAPSRCRSSDE
jgi:hypothetical protein